MDSFFLLFMKNCRSDLENANQPITQRAFEQHQEEQRMYKILQYESESPKKT